jgi:hypothetical protein
VVDDDVDILIEPEHLYGPWESGASEQVTSGMNKLSIDRDELLRSSGNRTDRKRRLLNLRAFVGVLLLSPSMFAATDYSGATDSHRRILEDRTRTESNRQRNGACRRQLRQRLNERES